MADPVYFVGIEFETGSFTEVTPDVTQFTIARELASLFSSIAPGSADFELMNDDGKYSPDYSASAFAGLLRPNLPVKIEATHSGSTYQLFNGFVDSFNVDPSLDGPPRTSIACRDRIKDTRIRTITTSLFVDTNVQSIFTTVLSEASVSSFSVSGMSDIIPFAWFRDRSADAAIQELIESGFHFAYVDASGIFQIKDRYEDQLSSVVASFSEFYGLGYALADDDVFNSARMSSQPRKQATSPNTVAFTVSPITVAASDSVTFWLTYNDPVTGDSEPATALVTPVNSSDYLMNDLSDGSGGDLTATASASVTLFGDAAQTTVFNGAGVTGYLTKFQIRGTLVPRSPRLAADSDDSSSQAVYGKRDYTLTNDLLGTFGFIQDYANFLIDRQKNPNADISVTVRNDFPTILGIDLLSKIHITNSLTGVASNHIVNFVEHAVELSQGTVHQLTVRLDRFRDQEVLFLDDPVYGKLDERKLGF